jgi:F0F1-type ATP synthase assembly protein I
MAGKKYPPLAQYAGLAAQMAAALGLGAYLGIWIDKWAAFTIPLFIWLLPLLILIVILIKVVKDTSKK